MLSVIIPTYNEADALPLLVARLAAAVEPAGLEYELVIVDDNSPDGTGAVADRLAEQHPIQVLHRQGKAGLASAVLSGLEAASGDVIAVMDADLSHPPELIPEMVRALDRPGVDLAVGSRYVPGGGMEDWPWRRQFVSTVANVLTRPLTPIRDATSGFFAIRRSCLEGVALNPIGFKIGLEVMARAHYQQYVEVPYVFTDRKHGRSKFGMPEVWAFLKQLAILSTERVRGASSRLPRHAAGTAGPDPFGPPR
ncbi:MAG: polyprenol monophosphomannose synthase [Chloroflexi bacterium]|nr:polyprenol monophosphomannose synthase [Chloroflexota bacterium]